MPIKLNGLIETEIKLQKHPDVIFKVKLYVLSGDSISYDLILGSDFLQNNNVKITIDYSEKTSDDRVKLFAEVVSVECAEDVSKETAMVLNIGDNNFEQK